MVPLKRERTHVVAKLLRDYYLSANFDFDEMANKIVSVLDIHYFKQRSKDDREVIINLTSKINLLNEMVFNDGKHKARLQQTRIKFRNKRKSSNGKNKINR